MSAESVILIVAIIDTTSLSIIIANVQHAKWQVDSNGKFVQDVVFLDFRKGSLEAQ